ncbi:metallophosphoesterase [Corynebacterium sp. CNCTC7651]|uniref:metallophosphoesterase family protein n=1 Tax=Corynebacterium sp. CNCTC7651 TaxID=2815361 RepID=UPI001F2A63F4|nr:metallophosphoesterase [Corynebacterium sp. CNCTC7651]UIZ92933.1 metallophosphoesterase [Corynebacterium sp. CNCTC7651]
MAHAVTFIHTSDLQIGMTRSFLPAEAQSRFDDSRLRAIERIGALATERGAEFIVVAGDVFEHNALERATLGRALEALRALPVPVYLLPGNHDPLVADSIFASAEGIEGVHVLGSSEPITVRGGVEIVAAPLTTKYPSEDLCSLAIRDLEPTEHIRVLVGHGQVEGYGKEETAALINLPCLEAALENGTVDYVALGDTHSTQSLGGSGRVWFSGSPETTDYFERDSGGGEVDSGNALVVSVEKQGLQATVQVEKVPTGAWTFEARAWEVAGAEDVARLVADLREYPDKARTVVKYAITGTLGLEANAELQRELAALEPVFAALYERERLFDLRLAPSDEELENLPLAGYAREAMHELVAHAADGSDPAARDAVNLLYRLSKEG